MVDNIIGTEAIGNSMKIGLLNGPKMTHILGLEYSTSKQFFSFSFGK
jgi:hypothetical protein